MIAEPGGDSAVHVFVDRCQASIGRWYEATDLLELLSVAWQVLADLPTGSPRLTPAIASIVAGFATRLEQVDVSKAQALDAAPFLSVRRIRAIRAASHIRSQYRDPDLSLSSVAREVGITSCYVSRILLQESGYGFETHMHGTRVLMAALLLRDTLHPIGCVADSVGYRSLAGFDRHFRDWVHHSPSEFRLASAPRW
jgi:AraC-like DNA-binding protein